MFTKLYKLVFGLDEFTKTKIELRIELAKEVSQRLKVTSIEDFDLLESCIYKIKDQLRVKSSNLNNVIRDKNKDLDKETVENFLIQLTHLRDSFLNSAFRALKQTSVEEIDVPETKSEELSFTTKQAKVTLQTQGGLHIKVEFIADVDLRFLRILSSTLFDTLQIHGTSIIIEDKTAIIVPRTNNDGVIKPLPQIKNDEAVQESFLALTNKDEVDNYETNVTKKPEYTSKYQDEDSLDSMISNYEPNSKNLPKHHEKEDEEIIIEKGDPISFEKKEENPSGFETYTSKEETPPSNTKENFENQTQKSGAKEVSKKEEKVPTNEYVFYQDEEIIAQVSSKSPVYGEIQISSTTNKNLEELDESKFSYLFIFSKIFASILFDVVQAHGTTIKWDTDGKYLSIIPRFKDDDVIKNWSILEMDDSQLDDMRNQLLTKLSGAKVEEVEEPKKQEKSIEPKQEKVKFLLDELRKIP